MIDKLKNDLKEILKKKIPQTEPKKIFEIIRDNKDFVFDDDWEEYFGEYDRNQLKKRKDMDRKQKAERLLKLMKLAEKCIGRNNHETKGRIVEKIQEMYNIGIHRAKVNFAKMQDFNIISPTMSGTWYLTFSDAGGKLNNFNINS